MPDSNPVPVNESRELDAWLAEHLFGWASIGMRPETPIGGRVRFSGLKPGNIFDAYDVARGYGGDPVPRYSSTYEGMGLVLAWLNEHIAEPEDHFSMGWSPGVEDPPLLVGERYKRGFWAYITHDLKTGESYGQESLPTAVALAAKAALQAEQSR